MKNIKDELQHVIFGNEPFGDTNALKKIQKFLRKNARTSINTQKKQYFKSEEAIKLIAFAKNESLLYNRDINEEDFIKFILPLCIRHFSQCIGIAKKFKNSASQPLKKSAFGNGFNQLVQLFL